MMVHAGSYAGGGSRPPGVNKYGRWEKTSQLAKQDIVETFSAPLLNRAGVLMGLLGQKGW